MEINEMFELSVGDSLKVFNHNQMEKFIEDLVSTQVGKKFENKEDFGKFMFEKMNEIVKCDSLVTITDNAETNNKTIFNWVLGYPTNNVGKTLPMCITYVGELGETDDKKTVYSLFTFSGEVRFNDDGVIIFIDFVDLDVRKENIIDIVGEDLYNYGVGLTVTDSITEEEYEENQFLEKCQKYMSEWAEKTEQVRTESIEELELLKTVYDVMNDCAIQRLHDYMEFQNNLDNGDWTFLDKMSHSEEEDIIVDIWELTREFIDDCASREQFSGCYGADIVTWAYLMLLENDGQDEFNELYSLTMGEISGDVEKDIQEFIDRTKVLCERYNDLDEMYGRIQ